MVLRFSNPITLYEAFKLETKSFYDLAYILRLQEVFKLFTKLIYVLVNSLCL